MRQKLTLCITFLTTIAVAGCLESPPVDGNTILLAEKYPQEPEYLFDASDTETLSSLSIDAQKEILDIQKNSAEALVVIDNPRFNGYRIDMCLTWGNNCGTRAASVACKLYGFSRPASYGVQWNYGLTYVLADDKLCTSSSCDALDWILCE